MDYTVEGLEKSRNKGFRPKKIFGIILKEFLGLRDNLKILDVGCGTGFFTRIIAEQSGADVTGMDINDELIKGAMEISNEQNLNIKFELGDICNIKYPDNTFDIVMCDIMLECFSDITAPLKEMKRVCKSGGFVAAIEPFYQANFEYYPETDDYTRDLILKFCKVDRAFGVGPTLPQLFSKIGLIDIDLVSWLWGYIGFRTLEHETFDEKIQSMKDNIEIIKKYIGKSQRLSASEQDDIIDFYEKRLVRYMRNPLNLKEDMSISGLPVFIVKGTKQ